MESTSLNDYIKILKDERSEIDNLIVSGNFDFLSKTRKLEKQIRSSKEKIFKRLKSYFFSFFSVFVLLYFGYHFLFKTQITVSKEYGVAYEQQVGSVVNICSKSQVASEVYFLIADGLEKLKLGFVEPQVEMFPEYFESLKGKQITYEQVKRVVFEVYKRKGFEQRGVLEEVLLVLSEL